MKKFNKITIQLKYNNTIKIRARKKIYDNCMQYINVI